MLEKEGLPLGIVTAIDGVTCAAPSRSRASPGMPAPCRCRCARMRWRRRPKCCSRSRTRARTQPNLVATVGKLEVPRSAANTIPGRVRFTLDIRSPSDHGAPQRGRRHQKGDRHDRAKPRRDRAVCHRPPSAGGALRPAAFGSIGESGRGRGDHTAAVAERRRPRCHGVRQGYSVCHAVRALSRRREPQPRRVLHRPTISTSPRACSRLSSRGSHHHDHATHQGGTVQLRGADRSFGARIPAPDSSACCRTGSRSFMCAGAAKVAGSRSANSISA